MTLRPEFSFVRGTLAVTLRVLEAVAPTAAPSRMASKSLGSADDMEAMVVLAPGDADTLIHWTTELKTLQAW